MEHLLLDFLSGDDRARLGDLETVESTRRAPQAGVREISVINFNQTALFKPSPEAEWSSFARRAAENTGGGVTERKVLNLAARHAQGKWAVVYLADKGTVTVNLNNLAPLPRTSWMNPQTGARFTSPGNNFRIVGRWIDPRSGASVPAGEFWAASLQAFATPEGWEDAVLVLKEKQ